MSDIDELLALQDRIGKKLDELGFQDGDTIGNISHHLAEVAMLGGKLAGQSIPAFLKMDANQREELAELVVDIKTDLDEIRDGILEVEADIVRLMNHFNP